MGPFGPFSTFSARRRSVANILHPQKGSRALNEAVAPEGTTCERLPAAPIYYSTLYTHSPRSSARGPCLMPLSLKHQQLPPPCAARSSRRGPRNAGVAPRPPRHRRHTAAESRAAMLHGCTQRGSGTRLRLLPRSVLMDIGQISTPSSAQVTATPESSCAIVASEALASPRPPLTVMNGHGWGAHAHPPWRSGRASCLLPRSV